MKYIKHCSYIQEVYEIIEGLEKYVKKISNSTKEHMQSV